MIEKGNYCIVLSTLQWLFCLNLVVPRILLNTDCLFRVTFLMPLMDRECDPALRPLQYFPVASGLREVLF